jgi:hypothetical protein
MRAAFDLAMIAELEKQGDGLRFPSVRRLEGLREDFSKRSRQTLVG